MKREEVNMENTDMREQVAYLLVKEVLEKDLKVRIEKLEKPSV